MKKVINKYLGKGFLLFLFFYAGTMIWHTLSLEMTIANILFFVLGLALALFAHAKKNYVTIILLLLHMSIEWFEWSQVSIDLKTGILNMVHIVMDLVFLDHELRAHANRQRPKVLILVFIFLGSIFTIGNIYQVKTEGVLEIIEPFVIGGVLGCILSHLYFHLRKEVKRVRN